MFSYKLEPTRPCCANFPLTILMWTFLSAVFLCWLRFWWADVFDLLSFGFRDLGSSLTFEALLQRHLRPNIDFGYIYGLLPVFFQHISALIFGVGPWLIVGMGIFYYFVSAGIWATLWRCIGAPVEFFPAIILAGPSLVMILPAPAYALNQLSLMFSLLFLLMGRLSWALVAAVVGCLCMPTLPLVLVAIVLGWIVLAWLCGSPRTIGGLVRPVLPAAVAYIVLAGALEITFGWTALRTSLLPLSGAEMYRALNYGVFGTGRGYWHPQGKHLAYYLGTKVGWWLISGTLLGSFSIVSAVKSWIERRLTFPRIFIMSCFALHAVDILFMFGSGFQTMQYDPILIAGVLVGLWECCFPAPRRAIVAALVAMIILGHYTSLRESLKTWQLPGVSRALPPFTRRPRLRQSGRPSSNPAATEKYWFFRGGTGLGCTFQRCKPQTRSFCFPYM